MSTRMFTSPLFLGFDHLEQMLERASKTSSDGYPPYNIEQISQTGLRITLAVAGVGQGEHLVVRFPVPHFGDEHDDAHGQKLERTVAMAPAALPVVALPARTALIRAGSGAWRSEGAGTPTVFVGGVPTDGLAALAD